MQPQINASTKSINRFIPQSPAIHEKKNEISRWQQRNDQNTNQLNLLSKMESYFQEQQQENIINDNNSNNQNNLIPLKTCNKTKATINNTKKRFLRKGSGTINQRNKYLKEREKQAEIKRMKQLGLIQNKPKTQKILLMEQWREKQKKKDKILLKKQKIININNNNKNINNNKKINKINNNYLRNTKSFESNIHKSIKKSTLSNLDAIKLLKQKKKQNFNKNNINNNVKLIDKLVDNEFEEKTPSDELDCASKFDLQYTDEQIEEDENVNNDNTELIKQHLIKKPKLLSAVMNNKKNQYNFARNSVLSDKRPIRISYPTYSHHHSSLAFGNRKKYQNRKQNQKRKNDISCDNLPNANKMKYYSESKNLHHKQATINTISKRDRLAAKYLNRKANEPQINLEKEFIQKTIELENMIAKYEDKYNESQMMKQSSLEEYRKYQSLINIKEIELEKNKKDFEKYKKKQERILLQRSSEIDKKARSLSNIPDRKQRSQIFELKKEMNEIKLNYNQKEKRYKSQIFNLNKENKKIKKQQIELKNELKKYEQERLNIWKNNNNNNNNNNNKIQNKKNKKKRYSISKINANINNRPKTVHSLTSSYQQQYNNNNNNNNTFHTQSMNNIPIMMTQQQYNQYHTQQQQQQQPTGDDEEEDEDEYDSTSTESDDSSDEITENGEDYGKNCVLINNPNIQNLQQPSQTKNDSDSVNDYDNKEDDNDNKLPSIPHEYEPNTMTSEQMNCESIKNRSNPLERMQHPDGKIEHVYRDGSKLILFPNGTEKYVFSNLSSFNNNDQNKKYKQIYVKFPNNDVKKILFDGSEVYFYNKNNIIHVTKIDKTQLFYFSGQHEIHFVDNTKHILFMDGTKKYIYPNGDEQCVFPNGSTAKN